MSGYVSPATQAAASAIATSLLNSYKTGLDALANPAQAFLYQNAAGTSIANASTYTALVWDAASFDTQTGWSSSPNPSRWTCPTGWAGRYEATITVEFPGSSGGGIRNVGLVVNSGATSGISLATPGWAMTQTLLSTQSAAMTMQFTRPVFLNAGDYVQGVAAQTSGASLTTAGAGGGICSWLYLRWVSVT